MAKLFLITFHSINLICCSRKLRWFGVLHRYTQRANEKKKRSPGHIDAELAIKFHLQNVIAQSTALGCKCWHSIEIDFNCNFNWLGWSNCLHVTVKNEPMKSHVSTFKHLKFLIQFFSVFMWDYASTIYLKQKANEFHIVGKAFGFYHRTTSLQINKTIDLANATLMLLHA